MPLPFILTFAIQLTVSYALSKLTAPDGPRLKNKDAASGDYGVPMPRLYGERVRVTGAFIAQADIDEDKHKVKKNTFDKIMNVISPITNFLPQANYYTYSVPALAVLLSDRTDDDPIEGVVKLWANSKLIFTASESDVEDELLDADGKLIYRRYGKNKYMKGLTVYGGHEDQPVDPILAGQQEISEDTGYIFSAYAMIDDLQLAQFGNTIPAIEALVEVKAGQSVAKAAESICAAAGIDPLRDVSTTALTGNALRGYAVTSASTCWDAIKPLLPSFAIDAAEVVGQIRFYKRAQTMRSTITLDEMGAHVYGDSPPQKALFKRAGNLDLPRETSLTWIDLDRDYQPNTATSRRSEGDAKSNVNASVSIVLSADEGASAAALMHWDAWLGRTQVSFLLTDAWITMATGLAYGLPVGGQVVPYRITRKLRGANGIIEVEAISDESVTYTASIAGTSGTIPPNESTLFPDTRLVLMDMPIIDDEHDEYGFYLVIGESEPGWTRGIVQASEDGVNFVTIGDEADNSPLGDVVGTLAAGTTDGLDDTLDTTTVLTVILEHDLLVLESATDDELDAGKNLAFVGKDGLGEYLQFKTATKTDFAEWELTNLRRGRRGTDHAITTHASGEEFALLDGIGLFRVTQLLADWGDLLNFRGVTLHQDEADADIVDFTNTGEGKRPYSPVNVEGSWDGSYNLTATFDSRSRLNAGGLGIDDNFEFDVEITNATPVRTIVVTAETFSYSAADQVTDGLVAGQVVEGRVRQTSDVNDGRWREFTLAGPLATLFDSTLVSFDSDTITWDAG